MDRLWILLLLTLVLAKSSIHPRGLFIFLDNGELCLNSLQCKSGCCQQTTGERLARCADKAAENQECSLKSPYGVYSKCLCESGLICDAANSGICKVPST